MVKAEGFDKMTGKERMKALMMGEPLDRVPFMPFFVSFMAIDNGISPYDFYTRPDVAFDAGVETMKKYPWANIRPVYGWGDHGAWEFGGKIEWPNELADMGPHTTEPLISSPDEVDGLPDPDPMETDWFKLRTRFNDICVLKGFSVTLPSGSIMSQLASILGASNLMLWMVDYHEAYHRLAQKVLDFNLKQAKLTINKYGGKNCSVMTDFALESNTMISPETFKEFCLPYSKKLHGLYRESGVRATMIHLCGNHKGNMEYLKELPVPPRTIFSISEAQDIGETGEILEKKYLLAGNIPTATLQNGTPEEVMEAARKCLEKGKRRPGGFILMPACEWPPNAPAESLEAVKTALMEYGTY